MKAKFSQKRRIVLSALSIAVLASMQPPALAQGGAWPNRPIRLVVPSAPGGVADAIARQFAQSLSPRLGQQVIVENRAGAGTMVGTISVAKAPPDGYTILLANTSLIQNPIHYKKVGYDPFKNFTPLGRLGVSSTVLVVRPDLGVRNLGEFIKAARGKQWNYGASSTGPQVIMEIFNKENNLGMTGLSYKGETPAITDMIGGQIEMGLFSVFTVKSYVQAGKLIPIAVIGDKRIPSLPNVPTFIEQGHGEISYGGGWFAFMAPANLPPEISTRLTRELREIAEKPAERKRMEDMEIVINWTDGPAFAAQMKRDTDIWRTLVKRSNVAVEQ